MSTPTPTPPTPPEPDTPPLPDPDVRDSDPSAASRNGLGGDMGVSSERVPVDPDSIEGTGSRGTATNTANGIWPTDVGDPSQEWQQGRPAANVAPVPDPDPEVNPAEVPPHEFDRTRNPGHSGG